LSAIGLAAKLGAMIEPLRETSAADVPEEERQGFVNRVFAAVAARYDLMNDVMSGGVHRLGRTISSR
jgi:hypothetical protein